MAKRPFDELLRLAFIYAEQDRQSFSECSKGDDEHGAAAALLAAEFRAYRQKRWGKTRHEVNLENCTTVSIDELHESSPPTTHEKQS